MVLRPHFEEVLDLGFLVTYLLLLVEDEVGGVDGHDENYDEDEGKQPGGEDVVAADKKTGVTRGERVNVEGTTVFLAEGFALFIELFDVGIEGFVAGFEVFEPFKHGVVFDAEVVVVVGAEVGELLAFVVQKMQEFESYRREIVFHDLADFLDAELADGLVAVMVEDHFKVFFGTQRVIYPFRRVSL